MIKMCIKGQHLGHFVSEAKGKSPLNSRFLSGEGQGMTDERNQIGGGRGQGMIIEMPDTWTLYKAKGDERKSLICSPRGMLTRID